MPRQAAAMPLLRYNITHLRMAFTLFRHFAMMPSPQRSRVRYYYRRWLRH